MAKLHFMNAYIQFPEWISPYVIPSFPYVRWYGVMYIVAFAVAWILFRSLVKKGRSRAEIDLKKEEDYDFFFWSILGLLVGARVGSCLIYQGSYYWTHPWMIFWPFDSSGDFVGLPGMSYHGGVIGAVIAAAIYSKVKKKTFFALADTVCCSIPFGYFFGRMGNFFNGELWGRVSTKPWAMVFPDAGRFSTSEAWVREICAEIGMDATGAFVNLPRHPSQLYEAVGEGLLLGLFMWFVIAPRMKSKAPGFGFSWYLIGYGAVRFIIEYFREPDYSIGFVISLGPGADTPQLFTSFLNISMGQILCFIMIAAGVIIRIATTNYYKNYKLRK